MSGHSHYATIKRQKEANDAARGNAFSKLGRAITIAAKSGIPDPASNFKLRVAIEKARAANMPKANIERALRQAQDEGSGTLSEISYEGFGPGGFSVIVEVATDNKNRTGQEIKNIFERAGGSLAGPGAVSFNFVPRGLMVVSKSGNLENDMLELIDLGVEDMEESQDGIEVYTVPEKLSEVKSRLEASGFLVSGTDLIRKPTSFFSVATPADAKRAITFLETLDNQDDVQKVSANLDISEDIMSQPKAGQPMAENVKS